uniref:Antizyme inhibitor 2 n=1 Tax=Terrapene triunguis TaxID=2587831 RepID=A0A674JRR2_9SAUR
MSGYLDESDFMMVEEGFTTRDLLENLLMEASQTVRGAFFVADLGDVVKKHLRFLKALPHVKPFYAVKCNSSRGVVRTLAALGAGFDCASKIAATINSALDLYFPEGCGVEIIAKLGRYYVASAFTLAVNVIDKQEVPLDPPGSDGSSKKNILYYINDGIYGSFSCIFFDHTCPRPTLHKVRRAVQPEREPQSCPFHLEEAGNNRPEII